MAGSTRDVTRTGLGITAAATAGAIHHGETEPRAAATSVPASASPATVTGNRERRDQLRSRMEVQSGSSGRMRYVSWLPSVTTGTTGTPDSSAMRTYPRRGPKSTSRERVSGRHESEFVGLVTRRDLGDVHALVRDYVEITVETFERHAPLYRVLLEEVPRIEGLGPTQAVDLDIAKRLRLVLELAGSRVAPRDPEVAALLIVRALRYNAILILREPLEGRRREGFIDELAAMLCAYLFAPSDRWVGHHSG